MIQQCLLMHKMSLSTAMYSRIRVAEERGCTSDNKTTTVKLHCNIQVTTLAIQLQFA